MKPEQHIVELQTALGLPLSDGIPPAFKADVDKMLTAIGDKLPMTDEQWGETIVEFRRLTDSIHEAFGTTNGSS